MSQGVGMYNKRALGVTTPEANSASNFYDDLDKAAKARVRVIAPDADPLLVGRREYVPNPNNKLDTHKAASVGKVTLKDGRKASLININPNVDSSIYAHELGHAVSQKTGIGNFVNNARHNLERHPKLGKALATALMYSSPAVAAALQEGDDDLAGSMAIAAAIASPKLIDEALASKNALSIMDSAGIRASLGQRGRLAAGYLSYLAPVLLAGSVGNAVGNAADDYTALYDL